jgi:hypothetical protein
MNNQHARLSQVLAEQRITPAATAGCPCSACEWRSPTTPPAPAESGP